MDDVSDLQAMASVVLPDVDDEGVDALHEEAHVARRLWRLQEKADRAARAASAAARRHSALRARLDKIDRTARIVARFRATTPGVVKKIAKMATKAEVRHSSAESRLRRRILRHQQVSAKLSAFTSDTSSCCASSLLAEAAHRGLDVDVAANYPALLPPSGLDTRIGKELLEDSVRARPLRLGVGCCFRRGKNLRRGIKVVRVCRSKMGRARAKHFQRLIEATRQAGRSCVRRKLVQNPSRRGSARLAASLWLGSNLKGLSLRPTAPDVSM
eukprot:TRINITY_DN23229_c3_g1_i1.p1 TRINITY_DN23229_c3_g1~~TRINITY_DN23229_c3_g1_i1.p1  ORF type:complete len:271 (+),score=44.05 TRINITY_DN23229_c3_g1_i1:154-966(+)